jgi:hypothetical protein
MSGCPLALDALPRPLQKHADPAAPLSLRMMGAKGLVPAAPRDLATLLFCLACDPDVAVRDTAARTAEGLPETISGAALRSDEVAGEVLDWYADRLVGRDRALEYILLNPATLDATVARVAAFVPQRLAEIIRQNELRLLRHDDIVRQLCHNPKVLASTVDAACEFCVRNGLVLLDVPQLVEAHRRVYGVEPSPAVDSDTAVRLMTDYAVDLASEERAPGLAPASPEQDARRLTITQRVLRMSVTEKIKLATLGNKEARALLLRDPNKLVALAAVTSPRITEGEVIVLATSRTANADVLRHIYTTREYVKNYTIKAALVRNPKVPLPTALKFMMALQEKDIRELARDRNVPQTIQAQAKAWVMKMEAAAKAQLDRKH